MTDHPPRRRIPEATVARLPVYLRSLLELADGPAATISSERLAELAGVNAAKVRKDLSYLGSYGTRGVGYDVEYLLFQMSRELGLTQDWPVVIVGVGNLGQALANYRGFADRGFPVGALVDADPAKVGQRVGDLVVESIDDLPAVVARLGTTIGLIATPAAVAQEVADDLVAAGVRSILNFAPAVVTVPPDVSLRKVDLAVELQILSFYQRRRTDGLAAMVEAAAPSDGNGASPGSSGLPTIPADASE
ncbi:MAG TPA: redox-sensing transcriptional repressor Rex [Acidimicrobiales bacterium]|nr:redox-sensing transcriptional repressor Rex [Acidimicrobiales bacterium]